MSDIFYLQPVLPPVTPLGASCETDLHGHCLTCGDDARPAVILRLKQAEGLAVVHLEGQMRDIDITLLEDVAVGQIVLVHGGVALERLG